MTAGPVEARPVETRPSSWSGREKYFLGLLLLINTFNYLDRQVLSILAIPIQGEFNLKGGELGALSGLAFALLYTVTGLPVARLAERVHRPTLLGISIGVWSAFTLLCGAAQNFWQLAICRTGVGLGEAGGSPISYSLIVDRVPREKRATAISVFSCGSPIGALLGMALGGLIADQYGWRVAFLAAGVPGIILAVLAARTLSEPRGGAFATDIRNLAQPRQDSPRLRDALGELMKRKSFPLIAIASSTGGMVGFVHSSFFALYMMFAHRPELEQMADGLGQAIGFKLGALGFLGLTLGISTGVMGVAGTLLGGWLSDKVALRRGSGAYMTIPAVAKLVSVPLSVLALISPNVVGALVIVSVLNLVRATTLGPALSSIYALVRPELRPTAAAVLVFIIAVVGLGIGPVAFGTLKDVLVEGGASQGDAWRTTLISAEAAGVIGAILFFIARPIYVREATG